ncbi:hypothetical protein LSCM1_07953 [Leishmania martiniquensis]|uniref:Uncharacterized protein n=1 Tax=Leishmania martiniquensis TaxID=1580590 RepID=A0A836H8D0_9TRYP|nr:hypothetical protein LSCM1_07953 [Leishmania martiniquensis]
MMPTLDMSDIHDRPTVAVPAGDAGGGAGLNSSGSGGGGAGLDTGRQSSPRTSYLTSPRETSSLPSAHITRRAADVAMVLEMNPLQCHSVVDLQRKLIETAEWVMKLRHWYVHQLQERDAWYESRLRGLEDSFHASVAGSTAPGTVHAMASAGAVHTATGSNSTEKVAPSTVPFSRVAANGAFVSGATSPAISAAADNEAEGCLTVRRHSRTRKNSATAPAGAVFGNDNSLCPVNPSPSSSSSSVRPDAAVAGGGGSFDRGSSAPPRAPSQKQSAVAPTLQGRRTASASAARRQLLLPEDSESPHVGAAATAVDRGEFRPTLAKRSVAAVAPIMFEVDDDATRTAYLPSTPLYSRGSGAGSISPYTTVHQAIRSPRVGTCRLQRDARPATTPRTHRPSPANGLLSVTGATRESSDRFSASAGESGGQRGSDAQMGCKRYFISLPHLRSGRAHTSLPHYAQDLDAGIPRDATAAGRRTQSSAADDVATGPHETAPRAGSFLYLINGSDNNGRRQPKRRSFSSGGIRHPSRAYTSSGTKQNHSARGLCGPRPKGIGGGEASGQSSRRYFMSNKPSE